MTNNYTIELITNDNLCNFIDIECDKIEKVDHNHLIIDGARWELPDICGISFGEIRKIND
ncbi:hypothetical protein [Marinobacter salarius]|uniref:hypothetical protein n=1 Tax=Marinobacter salarius TaxID=1420917 RepID=UPI003BA88FD6